MVAARVSFGNWDKSQERGLREVVVSHGLDPIGTRMTPIKIRPLALPLRVSAGASVNADSINLNVQAWQFCRKRCYEEDCESGFGLRPPTSNFQLPTACNARRSSPATAPPPARE